MTQRAFRKIEAGLKDAIADVSKELLPLTDAGWLRNLADLRFKNERGDIQARLRQIADRIDTRAQPAPADVVERLVAFVQTPDWSPDAVEPEDSEDWRRGYEAAQQNLREELKPWWPLGGCPDLSAMSVSDEVERLREARVEDSGLFLALGIMLSGPIDEPNRSHFAKKCFDAADAITPGVSKDARQALTLSAGGS